MDLEPKKKTLKELIKNAYKENKLARNILAALREREDCKARRWPKQIRKLLRCNKSKCSIVDGLIYYRNRVFVPNLPKLRLEVIYRTYSSGPAGYLGRVKTLDLLNQTYCYLCKRLRSLLPHKDPTLSTTRFPKTTRTTSPPVNRYLY